MHEHKWGRVGLWENREENKICVPCLINGCTYGLITVRGTGEFNEAVPDKYPNSINGIELDIEDHPVGGIAKIVMREITEDYELDKIDFRPGDVVIDIGAHVGVVSIYLAKKFNNLRIYAFEPIRDNYKRLLRNIQVNQAAVTPANLAVAGTRGLISIKARPDANSGGASLWLKEERGRKTFEVDGITLPEIFDRYGIEHCKLLKIDCEGNEYNILKGQILKRVDILRGEFHTNSMLKNKYRSPARLEYTVKKSIPDVKVHYCNMAE